MKKSGLSLAPLTFEEAVTDLLKIKPEPKPPKPSQTAKARSVKPKAARKAPKP